MTTKEYQDRINRQGEANLNLQQKKIQKILQSQKQYYRTPHNFFRSGEQGSNIAGTLAGFTLTALFLTLTAAQMGKENRDMCKSVLSDMAIVFVVAYVAYKALNKLYKGASNDNVKQEATPSPNP